MTNAKFFNREVPLPTGLEIGAIRKAVDYIERELADLIEIYSEQANVFSALVGIYGAKALDVHSVYEKNKNMDIAQQRFPDLMKRGSGDSPAPEYCLESKASKRPWALQSHYDHAGWYIVWRYMVDPTSMVEAGKPLLVWRVDVAFLTKEDWKYEGSSAGTSGGGRTHTFGLKNAAKRLAGKAVYARKDVIVRGGKAVVKNGND